MNNLTEQKQLGSDPQIKPELVQQIAEILSKTAPSLRENPPPSTTPRVLLFTVRYHYLFTPIETVLAHALRLHGARVDMLLCDQLMPACNQRNIDRDTDEICSKCWHGANELFTAADLPVQPFSDFFKRERLLELETEVATWQREALIEAVYLGVEIGKIAYASTLRHFLRGRLTESEHWDKFRQFLVTAMMMAEISRDILDRLKPQALVVSHGIYVSWGVMAEYARQHGVKVMVYTQGYRRNTILASQGRTYHYDLLVEPVSNWQDKKLNDSQREQITNYLQSRVHGSLDWINYHPNPQIDYQAIARELDLQLDKPIIGLFTNLAWDAAVLFRGAAFPDMNSWVLETICWAINHPDRQLVIRCHPAEVKRRNVTREKIGDVIRAEFSELPPHIKIIRPENDLSTYTLSELIDLTVVYSTKVGLEFAARGLPVLIAGEAFYRNKGFTTDPETAALYFERLEQLEKGKRLPAEQREFALRYAYHYFFRRHFLFDYFGDQGANRPISHFKLDDLSRLSPGCDTALDHFCEAVLYGKPLF